MRRKDKEITAIQEIEEIIGQAKLCRLGLSRANRPYIVPLSFGYADRILYFHSAPEGEKLEIMRENSAACFEIDLDVAEMRGDNPCNWSMRYRSVVGFGEISFLEDMAVKKKALAHIIGHYSEEGYDLSDDAVQGLTVFQLKIEHMTGKKSKI